MAVNLATEPLGSLCHTSIIKLARLRFSVVLFRVVLFPGPASSRCCRLAAPLTPPFPTVARRPSIRKPRGGKEKREEKEEKEERSRGTGRLVGITLEAP